jgi:hypothetical protein
MSMTYTSKFMIVFYLHVSDLYHPFDRDPMLKLQWGFLQYKVNALKKKLKVLETSWWDN